MRDLESKAFHWKSLCGADTVPGESESGKAIHIDDIHSDRLKKKAREAREQPTKYLEMDDIFGELANAPEFREDFSFALKSLWSHGVEKTLQDYILAN